MSNAHLLVAKAIREGVLQRTPCEICGDLKVQGHHENYSKPLEVRWLCTEHHRQRHVELRQKYGKELPASLRNLDNRVLLKLKPETDKLLPRAAGKEGITKSEFVERAIQERLARMNFSEK
jgi:ribbon-helix-helix CopG family protein